MRLSPESLRSIRLYILQKSVLFSNYLGCKDNAFFAIMQIIQIKSLDYWR